MRFASNPNIITPPIFPYLTSKRVLTMAFIPGAKVNDIPAIKALGLDPVAVGKILLEVFSEMIFVHSIIHCDPHPGNGM